MRFSAGGKRLPYEKAPHNVKFIVWLLCCTGVGFCFGNYILDVTDGKMAEDSRQAGALEIEITPEDVDVLVDAYY